MVLRGVLLPCLVLLWLTTAVLPQSAVAATVTWDGGAGTTEWMTPANWSGDVLPGAGDDVVVAGDSSSVVLAEGASVSVASLIVDGATVTGRWDAVVTAAGPIVVTGGGLLDTSGAFRSNGGTSRVDASSTWRHRARTARTQAFTIDGTVQVESLSTMNAAGTVLQRGTLTGTGTFAGTSVMDTGTTTVRSYGSSGGTLTTETTLCRLTGSWHLAAGADIELAPNCESDLVTLTQDAGATLRLTITPWLADSPWPEQDRTPLVATTLELDGTVVVDAQWAEDVQQIRVGTIAKTVTGMPTITETPAVADGPGSWTASVSLAGGELDFTVTETSEPSAVAGVERLRCGSSVFAGWQAATDPDSPVTYRVVVDDQPDTEPGDTFGEAVELPQYQGSPEPGTWWLHVRAVDAAGNLGAVTHVGPWVVAPYARWTGAASSDWTDPGNWENGLMADGATDAVVQGMPLNDPWVGADASVGCLHLSSPIGVGDGVTVTTDALYLGAGGDVQGGAIVAPHLEASDVEADLATSTSLTGVDMVNVASSSLMLDAVEIGGSIVSGASQLEVGTPLELDRLEQSGSSRLAAPAITVDEAALEGGRIATPELTVTSGVLTGILDVDALHQADGSDVSLRLDAQSLFGTWFVDGGTARPLGEIHGSIDVAAGARLAMPEPYYWAEPVIVHGAARIDGSLDLGVPVSTSPQEELTLLAAAGGLTGLATIEWHPDQVDPMRVLRTATTIGVTWDNVEGPTNGGIGSVLTGAATADGSRDVTIAWNVMPIPTMVTGVSIVVDQSPTTVPDTIVDDTRWEGTTIRRLTPGTWYAHVRGVEIGGHWGPAAHSQPIVVAAPTTTDPEPEPDPDPDPPTEPEPLLDRCSNIAGAQAVVPTGLVRASNGTCIRAGSGRADSILGSLVRDVIRARGGNDTVRGRGGNDDLYGGAGRDRLYGDAGADRLFGELGNDRLIGGAGRDTFDGGAGADVIEAADRVGREPIRCGSGRDIVIADRNDRVARDCEVVRRRR